MRHFFFILTVLMIAACGQASDEAENPTFTPEATDEVNPDGSLDISSGADLGISVEITTPEEGASVPPGTVRYEQQRTGNYFIKISGEQPVTQLEMTISGSLGTGEYPVEICPSFLDEEYTGVCMNFIGLGAITRLSDEVQGQIAIAEIGEILSGMLDVQIETPVDGDRVTVEIVATFDELSLTDEQG